MISITEAPGNTGVQGEIIGNQIDEFLREDFNANLLLSVKNNPEGAIDIEKFIRLCLESINTLVREGKIPEHLSVNYREIYQALEEEAANNIKNMVSYEDKFMRFKKLINTKLSKYIDIDLLKSCIGTRVYDTIDGENRT